MMTDREFQQSEGLGDWRVLGGGAAAWFDGDGHTAGAALAREVLALGVLDLDVRRSGVLVHVPRGAGFGPDDVAAARAVSAAAARLGRRADPRVPRGYQVTLDAADAAAVLPFWARVLGYDHAGEEHLVDPWRRSPSLRLQESATSRALRQRLHLDVSRPGGVAAEAADEAGGTFVGGPYGLLAADAEGNEVDLVPAGPMADGADGWHALFTGAAAWRAEGDAAAAFVDAVAALATETGVAVKLDVRPGLVFVDSGKDVWETDPRFGGFASRVSSLAQKAGLAPAPEALGFVQVVVDAVDVPAVRAWWREMLGYLEDPREGVTDLVDPRRLGPELVFQPIDAPDPGRLAQRNRFRIDLFVPDDLAPSLVQRAVATGGRVVSEANAPFELTVADPEGNELGIAVVPGRQGARAEQA